MEYLPGEVWWGPAPHKSGPSYRPWMIVSDDTHPFSHVECIAVAMTTQQHSDSIAVPDTTWVQGGSNTQSYISPWYVVTIKQSDFDRCQGKLEQQIVSEAIQDLHAYTQVDR